MSNKIKFAVIGAGHIGKRHATMIMRNPEAELVALCDIKKSSELNVEEFAVPFFPSVNDLMQANLDIDVACICTPNGLHASQALIALENDMHVVCEKPMGLTRAECEQVIHKSLHQNKSVFCVMQNRYSPPSQWMKNLMDEGHMGNIFSVLINCYWNRDDRYYFPKGEKHPWKGTNELDGGTLFTQFSHFIDMMYWLFGDITDISAKFDDFTHQKSTEFEDSGSVHFRFLNGGIGVLNYSTAVWDKNMESSMTVVGEKGSVKIGGQYMNEVEYCHIDNYTMPELPPTNPANDYGPYKGSAANHVYVIENVVDVLNGRKPVTTNALEGLKVVEIIERIYEQKKS